MRPPRLTRFGLSVMACLLAGCIASGPAPDTRDYAAEPHPVYPVNRAKFADRFQPRVIEAPQTQPSGTVLIDTQAKTLTLVESPTRARRYGVAVGREGLAWRGTAKIGRMARWPDWHPTAQMRATAPGLPARIAAGPANPLGARALYLYQNGRDTLYRIHGTSEPWTIGTNASSGCIRMLNEDVIDLYDRVQAGAVVIVR